MSLSSKAVLVSLNINLWTARRVDERATKTVADRHKVDKGMGRYNKCLIDVEDETFKAISQMNVEAREWHYGHTLGWVHKGVQLLPAKEYLEYANQMRIYEGQYMGELVPAFVAKFPKLMQQAEKKLNGLFNPSEYPTQRELERKYGFEFTFLPVPDTEHFLVQVSAAEEKKMKEKLEGKLKDAQAEAMRDCFTRLYEPVSHMAAALKDPERRFHDTLVGNLKEVVDVLPRLNLTDDDKLNDLIVEVRKSLCKFSPQSLRDDEEKRAVTAKRAAELAAKMKGMVRM